jgi:FkbM family methyltransferase
MKSVLKRLIKKAFNYVGVDIIRMHNSPEQTLIGLLNYPIRSIIDVGANKGQFARYISNLFPGAHIYCFEPLPEPFKKLNQWAEKRKEKVKAFNIALGDREGMIEMFVHVEHSPSSSFLKTSKICERLYPFAKKQISIPVKMTTLDNCIKRLNYTTPEILIKLDVQGYEDKVIKGGQETFNIAKACILEVSLDELYEDQATFKDISLLLYGSGYYYAGNLNQTYAPDGHVIFIDAVFINNFK